MSEEKKEFIRKLKDFCLSHGYEIAGTCESESIYGEIWVHSISEEKDWNDWDKNKFNFAGME